MANGKKGFVLYCDLIHTIEHLTELERGKLFTTILEYVNDNNPIIEDRLLKAVFEPIKQQLKRDLNHWESVRGVRSEAGKKGGLAKQANARSAKQNLAKPSKSSSNSYSNSKSKVTVKDKVIVKETVKENNNSAKAVSYGKPEINELVNYLKEKTGSNSLDDTVKNNRNYCNLLINKIKKENFGRPPVEDIKLLIDHGLKDNFHGKNITSFKYLYNHSNSIIKSIKGNAKHKDYERAKQIIADTLRANS